GPRARHGPRRRLVQHHPQRPDIASLVAGLPEQHFRCEIRERSGDTPATMRVARSCRRRFELAWNSPGKTEVEHFRTAIRVDDNIGRLEIAVDNAAFVRVSKRVGDLNSIAHDRIGWETTGWNRLR